MLQKQNGKLVKVFELRLTFQNQNIYFNKKEYLSKIEWDHPDRKKFSDDFFINNKKNEKILSAKYSIVTPRAIRMQFSVN